MKIWHPLIKPDQTGATTESNLQDIEMIRQLPEDRRGVEIDALIEANLPLVILKVESYLDLYPGAKFLQSDMISEGLLALTQSVQNLATLETPEDGGNPNGYIGNRILWAVARVVENEDRQQVPEGYRPPYPLQVDPRDIVEIRDLLEAACQTPEDVIIMEMRERGCIDQEIADRLGIARRAVCVQRHEMMGRYNRLLKDSQ